MIGANVFGLDRDGFDFVTGVLESLDGSGAYIRTPDGELTGPWYGDEWGIVDDQECNVESER